ncbi:membrane protein-like protein [Oceaniovalibus guishaninsula JLT2003]|uniref:Membrane protein-like protein n=1 Tax=Oceaniovalibus guishaninsula JLT2003 TaxID=1231392 RepID=K2H6F2_9RHOB|nr:DUF2339 domain-containing protein [Oceaniovalibus guishaninsula]EKE43168.1 membrane protein-like protein [Oceaniovalibus guishaninsula JLT2003]
MNDLAPLLNVLVPLAVLWLVIANRRLGRRISALERLAAQLPAVAPPADPMELPDAPRAADGASGPVVSRPAEQSFASRFGVLARGAAWLRANGVLAVSALSLSLAGLFATQYAAERGMLSPGLRVAVAMALGVAFVVAGDAIRRRATGRRGIAAGPLAAVFAGAGVVTVFGAVLAARMLYAMIGPDTALAGLVAVAALAVALGWFHGPALAAIGILGASGAPFLIGGETGQAALLQGYFGMVAIAGLTVNVLRRWRGIDALSLATPFCAAWAVMALAGGEGAFLALALTLAPVAIVLMHGTVMPDVPGPGPILARVRARGTPTGASIRALVVWGVAGLAVLDATARAPGLAPAAALGLAWLFAVAALWSRRWDAALDMAAIVAAALFVLTWQAQPSWIPAGILVDGAEEVEPGAYAVYAALAGAALAMAAAAVIRSAAASGWQGRAWAFAAAIVGPGVPALMELLWPAWAMPGTGARAALAMTLAATATGLAVRAARRDGDDRVRTALAALVAMSALALALFVTVSAGALSLALGVLVLGAAALDDRFDLPALSPFVQVGVAVLIWRGLVDPGLAAGIEDPALEAMLLHGVPAILVGAAWLLMRGADRPGARASLEGGGIVLAGIAASVWLLRLADDRPALWDVGAHWLAGLLASVWLLSAAASIRGAALARQARGEATPSLRHRFGQAIRYTSASVALLVALALMAGGLIFVHPLAGGQRVAGPVLFNTLVPGYLLPATIVLGCALRLPGLGRWPRLAGTALGGILVAHWAWLAIAHGWRGPDLAAASMGAGELWTMTAVLLLTGAALFGASLIGGSRPLRMVANSLLLAAIAKVFLVDVSGLDGLVRAGSFLILGLSLAGLAWVNRLVAARGRRREKLR